MKYFWKSEISVTDSNVDSRNMIKVPKKRVCKKLDKQQEQESFLPNTDNFLVFFIFLIGQNFLWIGSQM